LQRLGNEIARKALETSEVEGGVFEIAEGGQEHVPGQTTEGFDE